MQTLSGNYPDFTAQEIKDLRERLGLSRREFAAKVGVSIWLIPKWEAGSRSPNVTHYLALLALLGNLKNK